MMLNGYYTTTIFMTVFAMVIMIYSVERNVILAKESKSMMHLLFGVIIITSLCEWGGTMLDGTPAALIPLHIFVKTTELSLTPFIGILYGRSLSSDVPFKWGAVVLMVINVILEVISAFNGMIFYVDAQNVYHHGRFYEFYTLACVLCIGVFLMQSLRVYKRYQQSSGVLLGMLTAFLLSGIVLQMLLDVKMTWLTVAISSIMLYKFYGDIIQQIDGLTELMNRWGYDRYVSNFRGKGAILFFDVDRFKLINDTYGHAFGDESLQTVADSIRHTFSRYGKCFRIGGDEFCVILEKRWDETELLMAQLAQEMQKKREEEPRLPEVSMGCVLFDTDKMSISDAIAQADKKMYQAKKRGHEDPQTGRYVES